MEICSLDFKIFCSSELNVRGPSNTLWLIFGVDSLGWTEQPYRLTNITVLIMDHCVGHGTIWAVALNKVLDGLCPSKDKTFLVFVDYARCLCSESTWESLSPSLLDSFFLSGLLMYFCFWKVLSRAFRWRSENTARRSMPFLGFPLGARGHENVPGIGTTGEQAEK